MIDVSKLLREPKQPEPEDNTFRCRMCDAKLEEGTDMCPYCGEPARLITLSSLGKKLPIGILDKSPNGESRFLKDFRVSKLDWNKEREVAATWKNVSQRSDVTILDYILCLLAHTVTDIGGASMEKHDIDHRMYILGEMFAGDVFYMYAYLRVHSIGPEFHLRNVMCPKCQHVVPVYEVDLSSIEVLTRDDPEDITKDVELRNGFKLAGDVRKKITLQPASFRVVAHSELDDDAQFFADVLKSACTQIEGVEGAVITDDEIAQMSPYDLALVRSENDWLAGGIDWSIDIECESCKTKFNRIIDWRYGNFFSLSSRSRRKTKL